MAYNFYGAITHTGGTDGALDAINGGILNDGDGAIIIDNANQIPYIYTLDATSGAAESSPDVIKPDSNAGDKRWIQVDNRSLPAEWTGQQNFDEKDIGVAGATQAWDLDLAQCAYLDLADAGENTTIAAPTNQKNGGHYDLRVEGDGSSTLSFNAAFDWGEQSAPAAPAANGDILICSFRSDGSTMYAGKFCLSEA